MSMNSGSAAAAVPITIMEAQRKAIVAALQYTHGNVKAAADVLWIARITLIRKIKAYEIKREEWE
jgi:transcriptional regulator of acetoin/glycerol metabolism